MNRHIDWLPKLELYNEYGDWQTYIDALYEIYLNDFIRNPIYINGKRIKQRREPQYLSKDKAFWHICYGNDDHPSHNPDFRRLERIRWPKAIILNRNDVIIKIWEDDCYKGSTGKLQVSIWFNDEYLVILEPRKNEIQFITAYCTDRAHKRLALEKRFRERGSCGHHL